MDRTAPRKQTIRNDRLHRRDDTDDTIEPTDRRSLSTESIVAPGSAPGMVIRVSALVAPNKQRTPVNNARVIGVLPRGAHGQDRFLVGPAAAQPDRSPAPCAVLRDLQPGPRRARPES